MTYAHVVIGPYTPFGVELCRNDDKGDDDVDHDSFANDLFRIENKGTGMEQYRHNTGEIAMYNIISLMWEFEVSSSREYQTYKIHIASQSSKSLHVPEWQKI